MTEPRPGIAGVTPTELAAWVDAQQQPAYRARQIADAIWTNGGVVDPAELRTLPASLRSALARDFVLDTMTDTEIRLADGAQTEKALHRLADGALIESVLMHYPARGASRR